MSDIVCRVCGEPWDTWGVSTGEGDLTRAEYRRLLLGRGCPHCDGQPLCECGHPRRKHAVTLGDGRCLGRRCECERYAPQPRDYGRAWEGSIEGEDLEAFERALYD